MLGLPINASNKVLTLHLLQRMNQIQLPTNIQAIRLETKLINIMSHHFQMLVNSNKEVNNLSNSILIFRAFKMNGKMISHQNVIQYIFISGGNEYQAPTY